MNKEWVAICSGISYCLLGKELPFPENIEWSEVFSESKKQRLTAIVFYGLERYIPEKIKRDWSTFNKISFTHTIRLLRETQQLNSLFQGYKIPYVILKGSAASIYYPEPLFRAMGDIDLFVLPQDFDRTRDCMLKHDFSLDKREENNPRHMIFLKNGIRFELHHYFGGPESEIDKYIINGFNHLNTSKINGNSFFILPKLENGLVILDHIRQELEYGLGLRQVLDWMMYVDSVLDEEFWNYEFKFATQKLGLEKLAMTLTHMAQMYLGLKDDLHWCRSADDIVATKLMESLISSGNFGNNYGSGAAVERTVTAIHREGLFHYLQYAGEYNWNAYHNHRWLKPFAWLYQIGRYTRQGFNTGRDGKQIQADISRGTSRYELLKELGI